MSKECFEWDPVKDRVNQAKQIYERENQIH
jgi:hypothetical protein